MIVRINGSNYLDSPSIGLALSGGGLRGLAHIGVLQALKKHRIPIQAISGTSAGSIIAALYASGYSIEGMIQLAEKLELQDLVDIKIPIGQLFQYGLKWLLTGKQRLWSAFPSGMVKGEKIEAYFNRIWGELTFKDTKIPLAITAVDVHTAHTIFFMTPMRQDHFSILNARYCHQAKLSDAVRASISIPGIFSPKVYRGMTLVDGAVKNNLPTDILKYLGVQYIIAVDLGYQGEPNYSVRSVGEILLQCIEIMGREVTLLKGEQWANKIIRPQTFDITFKKHSDIHHCIERGIIAAEQIIPELKKELFSSFS